MRVVAVFVVALLAVASAKQFYDSEFDRINVGELLDNPKLIKNYANCFLGGPCNRSMKKLRDVIQDAMRTACERCSPKQIELFRSITRAMSEREPQLFHRVLDKFDPTRKLRQPFHAILGIH